MYYSDIIKLYLERKMVNELNFDPPWRTDFLIFFEKIDDKI
jgi:hypothetical protein